eukprot:725100-Amphidinium_carterae.1
MHHNDCCPLVQCLSLVGGAFACKLCLRDLNALGVLLHRVLVGFSNLRFKVLCWEEGCSYISRALEPLELNCPMPKCQPTVQKGNQNDYCCSR